MMKQRFQIRGMHCVACAMTVDGVIEDLTGVQSASTNYARQWVDVIYDETKVTEQKIIETVNDAGYDAMLEG